MDPHIFSILPIEVFLDHRLTLIQTRVLGALLSFRGKNTNTVWPSRDALAKRCGYSARTISETTTQLEQLGWLNKTGKGGKSKACVYNITVPDPGTVLDPGTVTEPGTAPGLGIVKKTTLQTVPCSGTVPDPGTVPGSTSQTVPDPGRGIEVTKEHKDLSLSNESDRPQGTKNGKQEKTPVIKKPIPNCPHQQIIDAYHELLPMCPPIRIWGGKRERALAARWRDMFLAGEYSTDGEGLVFWRGIFTYIRDDCPFLVGKTGKDFRANLEWIVTEGNFAKIANSHYESNNR